MNRAKLRAAALAGLVCSGAMAQAHGGQKPGQPTPPPAAAPRVDFFEQTQRWFEIVRTHQIGQSDPSVAAVATMPATLLQRIVDDLRLIHAVLDVAAKKLNTSAEVPGRKLHLNSLPRLMGLLPGELDLPVSQEIELARFGDPNSHARQVISRIMIQAAMAHTYAAMQLEESIDLPPSTADMPAGIQPLPGFRQERSGAVRIRDGQQTPVPNLAVHWAVAREALDMVGPPAAESPTVHRWYQFATEYLQEQLNYGALVPHLEKARGLFPSEARVFLFSGAAYENLAAPRVQSAVDGRPLPGVGALADLQKEAERHLRRALALEPRLAIAQLRLGRVLDLTGRYDEAAALLRQAESGAPDLINRYLANLYLGHAEESRGRDADARAAYERAGVLFPDAQSPTLALAALAWRVKSREQAVAALRTLPARSSTHATSDPWWHADTSHVGDVTTLFDRLRVSAIEAVK